VHEARLRPAEKPELPPLIRKVVDMLKLLFDRDRQRAVESLHELNLEGADRRVISIARVCRRNSANGRRRSPRWSKRFGRDFGAFRRFATMRSWPPFALLLDSPGYSSQPRPALPGPLEPSSGDGPRVLSAKG
jgi:hypothetical protein